MRTTTGELSEVLSPFTLKGVTVPNRVVRTAHGTNIGRGRLNDDLIAYHLVRARGGVGLTILEAASVHRTDTGTLRLHDDSCITDFARLMEAVGPTGMRVFAQLGHLGHDGVPLDPAQRPWSASEVPSPSTGVVAHAMTITEIDEIIDCFAGAAVWALQGGLDGVEVHAAHGYLLQQFFSPTTNQRQDHYGGSFENRMRLISDVLVAVRQAVGPDFIVGVRTGADATDDGVQAQDCADLVANLEQRGLVDYVNVTYGSCRAPHKIIGAMHEPAGYELPTSEIVTKRARVPTIVTGRFRTLLEANEVIRSELADLVGMTRAHIADPDIVRKTRSGEADQIRPCIACNQGCVAGLSLGRLGCAVNPDVGFEKAHADSYHAVSTPRSVLVIGGGPAGLEAARVAALRGHQVMLCEAERHLGGRIRDARRFPHRALIGDIVDWLDAEVRRLEVDVRCSTPLDAVATAAIGAEVIVIATGARPEIGPAQRSSSDIATLDAPPPGVSKALVIDRTGDYQAIGVVERLTGWGIDVTLLTSAPTVGVQVLRELVVAPALGRIAAAPGHLEVVTDSPGRGPLPPADLVVAIDRSPAPLDVGPTPAEVHIVGDAAHPGHLWAAIRSANTVARAL